MTVGLAACELRVLRQGLHLSQAELASWLGVSQVSVSRWEEGTRLVPEGIRGELSPLLEARAVLMAAMRESLDKTPGAVLVVHTSDEAFWAAHPDNDGLPAAVQRAAAFVVAAETHMTTGGIVPIVDA